MGSEADTILGLDDQCRPSWRPGITRGDLVGAVGLLIGACILVSTVIGVGVAFLRH